MNISIANNKYNYSIPPRVVNFKGSTPANHTFCKFCQFDSVSFTGRRPKTTAEERMTIYANKLLKENNLKKGQPIYIKGESYYLPFMEILSREAYKAHSGYVEMEVLEKALESLKKKHNITEDFDYKTAQMDELKAKGALFFEFNADNDPYKKAKIYKTEVREEYEKKYTRIPPNIFKFFRISPKEILIDCLDLHKNQPLQIEAEREHLPLIMKLMHYLYSQNKTKLVDINMNNQNSKNLLLYADEEVLEKIPNATAAKEKELAEKQAAHIFLVGNNSRENENVPSERLSKLFDAYCDSDEFTDAEYFRNTHLPWLYYYAPTTMSAADAYPELAADKLKMMKQAYQDAVKINRVGHLKEHLKNLEYRIAKLNELLEKGYRTFKYQSINPETNMPDGKTDFTITVSPKSIFKGGRLPMPKYNHNPLVNVPTEEVFTVPLNDSAEGRLQTTKPLLVDGKLITDLEMEFKDGYATTVDAAKNKDVLVSKMKDRTELNRLGELAIVADSPIGKMNRIFNLTLLDENAASHFALGHSFDFALKDTPNFDSDDKLQEYLASEKINSTYGDHIDFMVGSKNIIITAINDKTGESIELVKNDKFLL